MSDALGIPVGLDELLRYQAHQRRIAAVHAQTQALRDLRAEIDKANAIAHASIKIDAREATRLLADMVSGQLGQRLSTTPTGKHYHYPGGPIDLAPEPKPTLMQRIRAWLTQ